MNFLFKLEIIKKWQLIDAILTLKSQSRILLSWRVRLIDFLISAESDSVDGIDFFKNETIIESNNFTLVDDLNHSLHLFLDL